MAQNGFHPHTFHYIIWGCLHPILPKHSFITLTIHSYLSGLLPNDKLSGLFPNDKLGNVSYSAAM